MLRTHLAALDTEVTYIISLIYKIAQILCRLALGRDWQALTSCGNTGASEKDLAIPFEQQTREG